MIIILKIALRNILHRKGFTAIGISAVVLIGIYLKNELTYDQATPGHEHIYRVINHFRDQAYTCMPFIEYYGTSADSQLMFLDLLNSYDEVEAATHFVPSQSAIGGGDQYFVETDGRRFVAENALYTNTGNTFQEIFPQNFLAGTPGHAFSGFNEIIVDR